MGILLSWPLILAVIIAIAIKTGCTRRLYYAMYATDLHEVQKDDYDHFLKSYTGQLTYERLGDHTEKYTDLLGKVRAEVFIQREGDSYYVSSHWWRRHADRDFR